MTSTTFAIYSSQTGCIAARATSMSRATRLLAQHGEGFEVAVVPTTLRCRVMVPADGYRPMQWLG